MQAFFRWAGIALLFATGATGAVLERAANTTLNMPPQPPVFGYTTELAFGQLPLVRPVAIVSPPGETNRLFILEQRGTIVVVTNLVNPTGATFMDIRSRVRSYETSGGHNEEGLLGMAFHPGYETNGYFYLFYTANGAYPNQQGSPPGRHARLARFQTSPVNPSLGLADSELPLISQQHPAGNHNGGDIHFGPDGYLYVALGDGGGGNDQYNKAQKIDEDFFASILRIDVDMRPDSLPPNPHVANLFSGAINYSIPPDNPYTGATHFNAGAVNPANVRTEMYAVGLRNPWRMSFDPVTGLLYCGDVGQAAREEINVIRKGRNYGWAFREGTISGPKWSQAPRSFVGEEPIQDYPWGTGLMAGRSVTGGVVYRGHRMPQLHGAYVFGDFVAGNIWALRYVGAQLTQPMQRLTGGSNISTFGVDPRNGDVLFANLVQGRIYRLAHSTAFTGQPFPEVLSGTGAFADLETLAPHEGIVPYDVILPFWADNARTKRWFSIPELDDTIGFSREEHWSFPARSVWIKHFDLALTNGVLESIRRVETQFLVKTPDHVYGVTYRWNEAQTEAQLVPAEGLDEEFTIYENGVERQQAWRYPSRTECLQCHTSSGGGVLGFRTGQLNRDFVYDPEDAGSIENQIRALSEAGYFDEPVDQVHTLSVLAPPDDEEASLEYRVRSYLDVNCSACHSPTGPISHFDTRITTSTPQSGLLDAVAASGRALFEAGSVEESEMFLRMHMRGPGQMPPVGSTLVDAEGMALLTAWILEDLPDRQSYEEWQIAHFGSTDHPDAAPDADPDLDGALNRLEFLTETNPLSAEDAWGIEVQRDGNTLRLLFERIANRGFEVEFSPDLEPDSWQPLEVPENRPFFFPASNVPAVVEDTISDAPNRYYRVRVIEP